MSKTDRPQKTSFRSLLLCLLLGSSLLLPLSASGAQSKPPPEKKTGGMMGDPAGKRGVEYGFDKGFMAGKTDKDSGLKPDPVRHEEFNAPEKFYRSEFGSRAAFVQGFKSGFVGGYQKAFGKKVKVSVPGTKPAVPGEEGSASSPITKPATTSTNSDAL